MHDDDDASHMDAYIFLLQRTEVRNSGAGDQRPDQLLLQVVSVYVCVFVPAYCARAIKIPEHKMNASKRIEHHIHINTYIHRFIHSIHPYDFPFICYKLCVRLRTCAFSVHKCVSYAHAASDVATGDGDSQQLSRMRSCLCNERCCAWVLCCMFCTYYVDTGLWARERERVCGVCTLRFSCFYKF